MTQNSPSPTEDLGPISGIDRSRIEAGTVVSGRYEILQPIGHGGFGWVYRALDLEVRVVVALKFFPAARDASPGHAHRVRREIRAARRISHANVVRTHDLGEAHGFRFITMEYVDGAPLRSRLSGGHAVPVSEAVDILRQVGAGVQAAHRKGVVHCDLKPGNVLIDTEGRPKILDFGLAHVAETESAHASGRLGGTPEYMAPEQLQGEPIGPYTDVYALGVMLYEMLTGKLPFRGRTPRETARARLLGRAPDPCAVVPSIPPALGQVVLRSLELRGIDRFESVTEMVEAADRAVQSEDDRPTMTLETTLPVRLRVVAAGRRLARWAPAALLLAAVALAIPSIRDGLRSSAGVSGDLLADGVVRLAVYDLDRITVDPDARMVASGLSEALRGRLNRNETIRVLNIPGRPAGLGPDQARALGVEQILTGRVGRLGDEIRVMISITGAIDRVQWMTMDRSIPWKDSWNGIDEAAANIATAYEERLKRAGAQRTGASR